MRAENAALVLAAGMGTRMRTGRPKVMHEILGRPLLGWALRALSEADVKTVGAVLNPKHSEAIAYVRAESAIWGGRLVVAEQAEPRGTGHAALCGVQALGEIKGWNQRESKILVTMGDAPLVMPQTFARLLQHHAETASAVSILAFRSSDPVGYGRVLTSSRGELIEIREQKDCSPEQARVDLCNSGIMCLNTDVAEKLLPRLTPENQARELYLTDIVRLAREADLPISVCEDVSEAELLGVNTQRQLAQTAVTLQQRIIESWMDRGVQFLNPAQVYLEDTVQLASGCIVEPFVVLRGDLVFAEGERIVSGYGMNS